jgi:hypothetical protein
MVTVGDDRQRVVVHLNSGDYQGYLNGRVASREGKEFGRRYEVELIDHPTLKKITVQRNQFRPINNPEEAE